MSINVIGAFLQNEEIIFYTGSQKKSQYPTILSFHIAIFNGLSLSKVRRKQDQTIIFRALRGGLGAVLMANHRIQTGDILTTVLIPVNVTPPQSMGPDYIELVLSKSGHFVLKL